MCDVETRAIAKDKMGRGIYLCTYISMYICMYTYIYTGIYIQVCALRFIKQKLRMANMQAGCEESLLENMPTGRAMHDEDLWNVTRKEINNIHTAEFTTDNFLFSLVAHWQLKGA